MKILLFLSTILLISCGPLRETRWEIPKEKQKEATEYITKLCEVSNPKSDEEPEDMIREAHNSAEKIFGVKVRYILRYAEEGWVREE